MHSYYSIVREIYNIFNELTEVDHQEYTNASRTILIISLALSISFLLIVLTFLIRLLVFTVKELRDLLKIRQNIDSKYRLEANFFILICYNDNFDDKSNNSSPTFVVLNLFVLICLATLFCNNYLHFYYLL
jgi:hypothetical protein